jgi:hypothetical protein
MALIVKDRVLESSTSTGTGSFTLTGAQTGYQSFTAIGNGNTTYYTIQGKNPDGTLTGEWEVGEGTWSTGNTLARNTVLSNSLGTTAKIDFSAGSKDVFVTYPSEVAITDTNAVFTTDITVNGLTVGRGDGNVSTNTAFGVDAIGSPNTGAGNTSNVAVGYNALNTIGSSVGSLTLLTGGSGYDDGFYLVTLEYLSGTPILAGGTFPSIYLTVESGAVIEINSNLFDSGFGFIDTTTVFQITSSVIGFGSGFSCQIATLNSASDNTVIGYNSGTTITTGKNNILIGSGVNLTTPTNSDTTIIGNANTQETFIKGTIFGDAYGSINTTALDVSGALTANGQLNLVGQAGQSGSFFTAATNSGTLNIGGTNSTGTLTFGRSQTQQTINIATGVNGAGSTATKTINIGTGATSTAAITNITVGPTNGVGTLTFGQSTTTGQTIQIGGSGNVINVGATTGTQTLTFGRSVGSQTVNIASGATASSLTKTVTIGTQGVAGSTTNIAIGSTAGTSTTTVNGLLKQQTYTVATLPTGSAGARSFVTDALAPSFGVAVASGGAVGVPVYHDGTSWKVG